MPNDPYGDILSAAQPDPNEASLASPRVKDFLGKIATSEGADYDTLVGGRKIKDLSRHPNTVGLTTAAGPSTAFGRYQITGTTDRSKLAKYVHRDYSPENQDLRAVELLRQTGALNALEKGDEGAARKLAGKEWASIPGSPLPGRKNASAWQQSQDPYGDVVSVAAGKPAPVPAQPADPYANVLTVASGKSAPTITRSATNPVRVPGARQMVPRGDELARQLGVPSTSHPLAPVSAPPETMDTVREGLGLQPNTTRALGAQAAAITEAKAPQRQSIGLQVTKERNPQTFREGLARGPELIAEKLNPFNWGKTEQEKVSEETERRVAASERAQSPEMIERRKGRGAMSGAARAVDDPSARALAGGMHAAAGVVDLFGLLRKIDPSGVDDQGWTPLGVSNYLHKRAQILEESTTNAPLTAEGKEIERGIPEKLGAAVGDLGLGVAQVIALKKATGLPLGRLLAIETGLKTSNETMAERAPKITESYVLGRALEGHLGRLKSAGLFAAPTAIGVAPSVLRGTMPLSDAALQVGVQTVAGGILGGKGRVAEEPAADVPEPVHHSQVQTRDAGQFGPIDPVKLVPTGETRLPVEGEWFIDGSGTRRQAKQDYSQGEYQILGRPTAGGSNAAENVQTLPVESASSQVAGLSEASEKPIFNQERATGDRAVDSTRIQPEPIQPIEGLRQYNVNGKLFTENPDQSGAKGNVILVTAEDGTKGWVRANETPAVGTVPQEGQATGQSGSSSEQRVVVFDSDKGPRAVDIPSPPDQGTVRLYRGSPRNNIGDSRPASDAPSKYRDGWFTTDPQEAADYAASNDVRGGGLSYIDIPADELSQYKAANVTKGKRFAFPLRENEFILPPEVSSKAIGLLSRVATKGEKPLPYETAANSPIPPAIPLHSRERSFPKTLDASGREGGTNRTYEPITNPDIRAEAARIVDTQGLDKAIETFKTSTGSATKTALGIELIDRLQKEAATHESKGNDAQAADSYTKAADVASHAAERLTEAGQEVQAASIAARYTPEGALREASRIAKEMNVPLTPRDSKTTLDMGKRVQESEAKIAALEKTVEELRKASPASRGRTSKAPRLEKIDVYFDRLAQDAQARLDARASAAKAELAGQKGQRGAGVNPAAIGLDIGDYAVIGAAKLAKGGVNFAQWSADMVRDLGEDVKPQLNKIFLESRRLLDEKRTADRTAQQERSAARTQSPTESLADVLQRLNAERAVKRQAKSDLDRHFRQLQRDGESKILNAVLSLTRDSLLSLRGVVRILGGMGGKQAIDFASRYTKAGLDVTQSTITRGPRTTARPTFNGLLHTIGGFAETAPRSIKASIKGEPSKIMPSAHGPVTENPIVNFMVSSMQRLYGGKEALIRSWAYPEELQNRARTFAINDAKDGIIKRSEVSARTQQYVNGRVDFDGPLNKRLVASLTKQSAAYEVKSKRIIPSMEAARISELTDSPTELLHALSLEAADRAVYAQPYVSQSLGKIESAVQSSTAGKIAKTLVLPFAKRPGNNIADSLFGYTGLRAFKEGGKLVKETINGEFNPTQVKAFNDAIAKGATGYAVMAAGAALARSGVLTSPLDKQHPGSIRVKGDYYRVDHVPVIGWLLGLGATFQHDGIKQMPKAFAKMILEHPLLRTAKEASEVTGEWKDKGIGKATNRFAGQTLSRFVPAPIKIGAEASDTQERNTSGVLGPTKASLPVFRQRLPANGPQSRLSVINPLYAKPPSINLKPRKAFTF